MGNVTYAERLSVLKALAESKDAAIEVPLLINFLDAVLVDPDDQLNFMAHVMSQPEIQGRFIAMVGLSGEHARAAVLAAAALDAHLRVFNDRDQALSWLGQRTQRFEVGA